MNPEPNTTHGRFEVMEVALEMVRAVAWIIGGVQGDLAGQLRRAASSVPLNIAEGNRRGGRDRMYHFRVAAGSCDETRAALRVAVAWGDVGARDVAPALALADRVLAMLYRLSRAA
jgi:four helix bundle protein